MVIRSKKIFVHFIWLHEQAGLATQDKQEFKKKLTPRFFNSFSLTKTLRNI